MDAEQDYYLELTPDPIRFEPVNQLTNVFFDDSNKDIFAVRSGGVMGVVVKGPSKNEPPLNFRMEDSGPVLSIKFSPDHKVLAVQRATNSIEFMNFNNTLVDTEYAINCKKNSAILGFVWSTLREVAIVTDHGIELYLVIPEKRSLKQIKTTSVTVQWFVWCPTNKITLLASAHGSQLQPVVLKPGATNKLPKVESRMALERDVTLATLYGVAAVLILRHQNGPHMAEVHVHLLNGPGQAPLKSHVLRLGLSGRFAINVVDDLILVHHQASRSSQVFDIALPGEHDGHVRYHGNVAPAKSMKPTSLTLPGIVEPQMHICELYSPNWVVFQPNIVIDAKLGCLWYIKLNLTVFCNYIKSFTLRTQVVLNRTDGKAVILNLLLEALAQEKPPLQDLRESFDHINRVYSNWLEREMQSQVASPVNAPYPSPKNELCPRVLIDQDTVYNDVFEKLISDQDLQKLERVLIIYLTSLSESGLTLQQNLNELLIRILARQRKFTALQQLLQYGVISDSKPAACLLLSLGNMHPSAIQMALDMLGRLGAHEEIQEILLSAGQVLPALKLANDSANPRKFLTAAKSCDDAVLFHSVLCYFQNNPEVAGAFKKDERLQSFVRDYGDMFNGHGKVFK
ncbi:regulator of MON1-CCZ1 complex isoform X2 [Cylas formicarius]|uniref:regulator of MON1-CCZ1 complex isoform X2 n=1 Tax=Cylas formicarius TaxID=197179 RepID=UPI002958B16C|nr:regulator of MON1-CCZ1 complex isoform X2 [Cylas formicarius]